jgi:mono/diheme cytochrome c family protein
MRGIVVLLLIAGNAQATTNHCPPQRAQNVRVYAKANNQKQQAYQAPAQLQKYVERVVVNHADQYSYSGLDAHYNDNYRFQVGAELREQVIADRVYDRAMRDGTLLAVFTMVQQDLIKQAATQPGFRPGPSPEGAVPSSDPAYQALFQKNNCLKCHSGDDPDGGLDFTDASKLTANQRWVVFDEVFSQRMPQGGTPVPDAEVDEFRKAARQATK